jgi:hypothetical protein
MKAEQMAEQEYTYNDTVYKAVTLRERAAYIKGWNADKWISVEEKLPIEEDADENGKVLIWREMNPDQKAMEKSIMDWSMLKYCDKKTTHWQPLPLPPKTK